MSINKLRVLKEPFRSLKERRVFPPQGNRLVKEGFNTI